MEGMEGKGMIFLLEFFVFWIFCDYFWNLKIGTIKIIVI